MKYVVLRIMHGGMTRDIPVIFPNDLIHSDVAKGLIDSCLVLRKATVLSAGECSSMDLRVECTGKSDTLNVKSREKADDQLIMGHDYFHGLN